MLSLFLGPSGPRWCGWPARSNCYPMRHRFCRAAHVLMVDAARFGPVEHVGERPEGLWDRNLFGLLSQGFCCITSSATVALSAIGLPFQTTGIPPAPAPSLCMRPGPLPRKMPSQQWRLFGVVVSLPEGSVRVLLHVEAVCYLPFVPQQELGLFLQASIIAWGLRGMWRAIGSVRFACHCTAAPLR